MTIEPFLDPSAGRPNQPQTVVRQQPARPSAQPPNLVEQFPQFKPVQPGVVTPVVSQQAPEPVTAIANPDIQMQENPGVGGQVPNAEPVALSVALPSKFAFYEFKDLFVHPIRAFHLAKFARAHAERSMRITAEVVSSLLTTTDPRYQGKPLAHMLTLPDFYFVLYFLRMNNYNKTQFTHTDWCNNPEHVKKVTSGELDRSTLRITEHVTSSKLHNRELEEIPVPDETIMKGIKLRPCTVQDSIEWLEHPDIDQPEVQFLGELAMHIDGTGLADPSFRGRMELVQNLEPDQIQLINDYNKAMMQYGIEEKIKIRCKECGASMETTVNIDAHSFLPN